MDKSVCGENPDIELPVDDLKGASRAMMAVAARGRQCPLVVGGGTKVEAAA